MEGRKEGGKGSREGGRGKRKKETREGEGGKKESSKQGRKHLAPNYWGLIFWRGDQQ